MASTTRTQSDLIFIIPDGTPSAITITSSAGRLRGILFTPAAANDELQLSLKDTSSTHLKFKSADTDSKYFDFSNTPIACPSGLFLVSITANASATLLYTRGT